MSPLLIGEISESVCDESVLKMPCSNLCETFCFRFPDSSKVCVPLQVFFQYLIAFYFSFNDSVAVLLNWILRVTVDSSLASI